MENRVFFRNIPVTILIIVDFEKMFVADVHTFKMQNVPGQVQRQLFFLGQCTVDTVAKTLLQAIEISIANDGDLRYTLTLQYMQSS